MIPRATRLPDGTPLRWQKVIVTPHVEANHQAAIMVHTEHVVLSRTAAEARALAADLLRAAEQLEHDTQLALRAACRR